MYFVLNACKLEKINKCQRKFWEIGEDGTTGVQSEKIIVQYRIYDTIVAKCSVNIVGFKLKVNHHEKQKQKYRKKNRMNP